MAQYELNLRDYIRIFKKRKFIIITTFITTVIGTVIYLSMQPLVYEAYTTVKIEERKTIAGLLTEWIVYSPADIMESQTKIIKGFPIMKKVALEFGLIDNSSPTSKVHSIIASLQNRIITETIKQTNIIRITASGDSARDAMDLANMVAQCYVVENLLEKTKQARTTRQFIEEQLAQLEIRLRETEEKLRKYGDEVKGIRLAEPIQKNLVDLEFKLSEYLQKYTENHPEVIQLREQIKELESLLSGFSGQELEYARLVREVEVNKKLYGMLKEKLEEARITEAQRIGDVSIVDPAVMPRAPVSPPSKTILLIGGMMGIILGIAFAFMFESLDTSIRTIEDVEEKIKLPVLGVVPSVSRYLEKEKGFFVRLKRRILPVRKSEAEIARIGLIVHYKPSSPVAEAYRNIRTNLKLGTNQKTILIASAGPREGKTTILTNLALTLAQRGAKTLLVSSDLRRPILADIFGIKKEPGLNEVITGTIDIDDALRNISDIMLGHMHIDEIIKFPGMENIWILPSGHIPHNPAEILESRELAKLIGELKKEFDFIFFDSPPVLSVTDATLISSKVDNVILCYEVGRTAREALSRAKVQLESAGAKISGVVLNQIAPQTETMATYPYYYEHKYGTYEKGKKG